MVEATRGVSFPVVFSDGETESEIGNVDVYPTLEFNRFQSVLSHQIGISPHQFSVFLSRPESRRRIPITGKVNFGAISREKNCFFLVALKRSRRERRRKNQYDDREAQDNGNYDATSFKAYNPMKKNPLENVMLLRRGTVIGNGDEALSGLVLPFSGRVEYENRVRELQIEKERYMMNMGLGRRGDGLGLGQRGGGGGGVAACEDCSRAKAMGRDVGFHWCAYDAVTVGFRSPAGPISRPVKGSE